MAAKEALSEHDLLTAAAGYCFKCKGERTMAGARIVTMKNGRKALRGTCPHCQTGLFKIVAGPKKQT
jgi:hypothetical protein